MPKRIGFLYERLCDRDFIRNAIINGSRKKHKRWDVKMVLSDVEGYVDRIFDIVVNGTYTPTQPKMKKIYDPSSQKVRIIAVQPFFPDGIIQQMLVAAMRDVLMRGMSHWCCASIPQRGGKRALAYARRIVQHKRRKAKYAVELDVKQFYPSIPQIGVVKALRHKIKDERFIRLLAITFSCYGAGQAYADRYNISPEEIVSDKIGMFIGFYINQWLANFYLEKLDQHITRLDGVNFNYRYMDNINVFGGNKRKLHRAITAIAYVLKELGLTLKQNWQLFPTAKRALGTVGYRIYPNKVILRKRNFLRLTRQCRKVKNRIDNNRGISPTTASSLLSRIGQLKHCDSQSVREKYIDPIKISRLKNIVRSAQIRLAAA